MDRTARGGRPMGELGAAVLRFARETQLAVTHLDCAHYLQMPREVASETLYNLRKSGHVRVVGEILQEGARKPVKVCEAVPEEEGRSFWEGGAPAIMVLDWPR